VPVIVLSMVLVVVGFVTLMLGVLSVGDEPLQFVYASIAACILAAVALIIGVLRGRPSKKPAVESGGTGKDAAWSGASAWNESGQEATGVIERDEPAAEQAAPRVQVVSAQEAAVESRQDGSRQDGGDAGWAPDDDATQQTPAAQDGSEVDDVVVVPKKRTAAAATSEDSSAAEGERDVDEPVVSPEGAEVVTAEEARTDAEEPAAPAAKKATAKKAAAKKATKRSAKKATAKKATAKKATAKKAAKAAPAKKAIKKASSSASAPTAGGDAAGSEAQKLEDVLGNVSGVGPTKRSALLERFGSYRALQEASEKDIAEIDGISATLAARIKRAVQ
jgi:predicted flap endonuclease-1-like 5' DNA nuclease